MYIKVSMDIKVPIEEFKINHTFKAEDFAPGIWAGTEGLKLTITKVDFENKTITLELVGDLQ
jgi:hypothetical protein